MNGLKKICEWAKTILVIAVITMILLALIFGDNIVTALFVKWFN